MESIVSIIVPFYNTPKAYIIQCLKSLSCQTYPQIEILIIDDGSNAENAKILDELIKSDSRIKVFHKPNGGVSSARNYGLNQSIGNYICFVDSDDWVEPEFVEVLISAIKRNTSQLAACNWIAEFEGHKTEAKKHINDEICYDQKGAYHAIIRSTKISGFLCNKIFEKNLVTQMLNENYHYCEDLVFVVHYLENINKMSYCNSQLYHYRQESGNATSNMTYNNKILSLLPAYQEVEQIYSSLQLKDLPWVRKNVLKIALNLRARYKLNKIKNKEILNQIEGVIKLYLGNILISNKISISEKINIIMTWIIPVLMFRIKCKLLKRSVK